MAVVHEHTHYVCLVLLLLLVTRSSCDNRKSRLSEMHPTDVLRSSRPGEKPVQEGTVQRPRPGRGHRRPLREELKDTLGSGGTDMDKPSTRFLLDLYEKLDSGIDLQHATGHVERHANLKGADTVRGVSAKVQPGTQHSEVTLNFKLPRGSPGERTELAELRVRPLTHHPEDVAGRGERHKEGRHDRHLGRRGRLQRIRVSVMDSDGDRQIQRVYRVSWRRDQEDGFSILDITRVLQDMISSGLENFANSSLQVSIRKPRTRVWRGERPGRRVRSVPALDSHSELTEADAMLVIYSRRPTLLLDDEFNVTNAIVSHLDVNRPTLTNPATNTRSRSRRGTRKSQKMCALKDMMVDFSVLGWSDYILYPTKFNAHACRGKCPTPVDHSYTPTNHAILQSMMRIHDRKTPRPCCVPVELKPLMILYKDGSDVEIREHPNMIVSKCGCL